jgi:hypothetical protein
MMGYVRRPEKPAKMFNAMQPIKLEVDENK